MRLQQFFVHVHSGSKDGCGSQQRLRKPPAAAAAARVVFCSCGLLDFISCLCQILVELFHCSSQNGQLSSISRVPRFIAAVIIFLRRAIFLLRFVKPSPETYWTSPADMRLLPCLHFCRCDSAGYSADLLC